MIGSIVNKFITSNDSFLKELYKNSIDTKLLEKMLLSNNVSINYLNKDLNSFLNLCIINNKTKSAQWLISKGINPLLSNKNGYEAIELAILNGNYLICKDLLNLDLVDKNKLDNENRSLLQNAVIMGQERIVNLLLEHDVEVNNLDNNNRNVIFDALYYGNESITNSILNSKDIDLNVLDNKGESILHKEEIIKDEELCKKLIKKGADPTICNSDGKNLLFHMALKGSDGLPLINIAIDQGYSLNTPIKEGNSLLMETLAVFYKLPSEELNRRESLLQMANELIDKGLDVNSLNEYGENALFEAVRNEDYDTAYMLIKNGVNVNKQNRLKQTPLLLACYKGIGVLDIILLLLHNKADPNIRNELQQGVLEILNELILHTRKHKILSNTFILMYLNEKAKYLIVFKEVLVNSKYNLEQLDSKGQPLFFTPLLFGDYDLYKVYISNGFKINSKNTSGLNLFYVYVNFVFNVNRYFDTFKSMLIRIIQDKVDTNVINENGKNIFSHVIKKETNIKLYSDLLSSCNINYETKDKQGRTLMHNAVLNKNIEIVKMINSNDKNIINVADSFGILPIYYALLIEQYDIVVFMLEINYTHIKSEKKMPLAIKEKFKPMLKNINNLKNKTNDKDLLRKMNILIDQVQSDFKI